MSSYVNIARKFKNLIDDEGDTRAIMMNDTDVPTADLLKEQVICSIREQSRKTIVTENKLIWSINRKTGITPNEIKNILTLLHAEGRIKCRKIENTGGASE